MVEYFGALMIAVLVFICVYGLALLSALVDSRVNEKLGVESHVLAVMCGVVITVTFLSALGLRFLAEKLTNKY